MEHSYPPPQPTGISPVYFTLAMIITVISFIAGATVGYVGRPLVQQDTLVQVVVTATPDPNAKAVAQNNDAPAAGNAAAPEVASTATNAPSAAANNPPSPSNDAGTTGKPTVMDLVLADARHFKGDPNAPVTIVEFSDFKCGFCGRFYATSLDPLLKEYVDTGKVRFAYKHFAILGPESNAAAEASECAAEQEHFWEYHDAIFNNQVSTHGRLSTEALIAMASELDLDTEAFSECIESGRYANQIKQEALAVQSLGIRGTPAFLVDGQLVSGAQPYEVFQQMIETQLQKN